MGQVTISCSLLALMVSLAGCEYAARDPWLDPGSWRETGANDTNLQMMVANPGDLVAGRGERGVSAILATTAVNRYLTDKLKPLPKESSLSFGGGGGGGSGGGQASGPQ